MSTEPNKKFWEEFIEMYRGYPCLWNCKCRGYRNKSLKQSAYRALVNKCKEVYPSANKDFVRKKILSFRCSARREIRKVNESKQSGCLAEEVYEPTLWYYDLISFIWEGDSSVKRQPSSVLDDERSSSGYNMPIVKRDKREKNVKTTRRADKMEELVCGVCFKSVKTAFGDVPYCVICKFLFHYKCARVTEINFRKMPTKKKLRWKCCNCKMPTDNSSNKDIERVGNNNREKLVVFPENDDWRWIKGHQQELDADAEQVTEDDELSETFPPAICRSGNTSKERERRPPLEKRRREVPDLDFSTSVGPSYVDDEFDVAGKRIAFHLRAMEEHQRIIAEKLVSDIMYQGRLGKLTERSSASFQPLPIASYYSR